MSGQSMNADLKAVLTSVESGLADIAETLGGLGERFDPMAVESAMADILEALGSNKAADLSPLVAAIRAMPAPVVHVNVQPAEVRMMEQPRAKKWTVTIKGDNYTPDRMMTIEAAA